MSTEKTIEYYAKLDKRTNEYKNWKKGFENDTSIGAGDIIEKVAETTGMNKLVGVFVKGEDCGCDDRKKALNQKYRIRYKFRNCFTEDQYNAWTNFLNRTNQDKVTRKESTVVIELMKHIFGISLKSDCSNCSSSQFKRYINEINSLYNKY